MKKRLSDKKAGIVILIALFIVSMTDVILRATVFSNLAATISNHGEVLITAILSLVFLAFALAGKDRIFYILCGGWLGYFVLNQLFELPGYVSRFVDLLSGATVYKPLGTASMILYVVSILAIVGIGVLLVEYLNDGTIYNKAYNVLCFISLFAILLPAIGDICHILLQGGERFLWLSVFNNLQRGAMVFLFVFFAYDTAKLQLKKIKFPQ